MKSYALFGLMLAIASTLLQLLSFFTGLQSEHFGAGMRLQWLMVFVHYAIIFLGVKEVRDSRPDQFMGFGSALGGAMAISSIAAVLIGGYLYVHLSFINPGYNESQVSYYQTAMTDAGMPDNVVEQVTTKMQKDYSVIRSAIIAVVITVVSGFLYGLLLAPTQTRRGSIGRIVLVSGGVMGFFGMLLGAFMGFMSRTVGSSAGIGLICGGGGIALLTYLLLKMTNYVPRVVAEDAA